MDIGKTVETLVNASSRALASITSKYYKLRGLDYKTFTTLYEAVVTPVMNYAAATWGHTKYIRCDTVQNKAMRTILGGSRVTPVAAMYSELNWIPPHIKQKTELLRFWLRLCKLPENRVVKKVFNHDFELSQRGRVSPGYHVKSMLEQAGLDYVWENKNSGKLNKSILNKVLQSEMKVFQISNKNDMQDMSRLTIYRQIKHSAELEKYINIIRDRTQRGLMAKARMGTLPIRVETGRYRNIPREERLCQFCDGQEVEDEIHILLKCTKYSELRDSFYKTHVHSEDITVLEDIDILKHILANDNVVVIQAAAKYIHNVMMKRSSAS